MRSRDRLILRDKQQDRISPHIIGDERTRGTSGRDLPEVFGGWNSVFRRFSRWSHKGVWQRISDALSDDPDFECLIVDATRSSAPTSTLQAPKGGSEDQALGRSRGGLSTKIHMAVRGLGCPVRFLLTTGQRGDAPQGENLLERLAADFIVADTAYDSNKPRAVIAKKGAIAVIPNNPSRALKFPLDKHPYTQRHLVECCFSRLKQFRRVATRFEKTARHYFAVATLAAIVLWSR